MLDNLCKIDKLSITPLFNFKCNATPLSHPNLTSPHSKKLQHLSQKNSPSRRENRMPKTGTDFFSQAICFQSGSCFLSPGNKENWQETVYKYITFQLSSSVTIPCKNLHISAVQSKNGVCAFIKHTRYFHQKYNFTSINSHVKKLLLHMFDIADTALKRIDQVLISAGFLQGKRK